MGRTASTGPQCLYKVCNLPLPYSRAIPLLPYGPYGLYRASVPVQEVQFTLPYSRAIPLLPIWAVRLVKCLSACTRGAIYLYLKVEPYLYYPYEPYGLYRASVPVQECTLTLPFSRAILLLPLWAVRPVQSLNACTKDAI